MQVRNQSYLRRKNKNSIIELLRKKTQSYSDLARELKLSNTAIANIVDDLISENVVYRESDSKGRGGINLSINADYGYVVAVDLSRCGFWEQHSYDGDHRRHYFQKRGHRKDSRRRRGAHETGGTQRESTPLYSGSLARKNRQKKRKIYSEPPLPRNREHFPASGIRGGVRLQGRDKK